MGTPQAVITTRAAVVLITEGGKPMLECFSPQFNHWASIKPRKTLEKGGKGGHFSQLSDYKKKGFVGKINEWSQEKGVAGNATKLGKM